MVDLPVLLHQGLRGQGGGGDDGGGSLSISGGQTAEGLGGGMA